MRWPTQWWRFLVSSAPPGKRTSHRERHKSDGRLRMHECKVQVRLSTPREKQFIDRHAMWTQVCEGQGWLPHLLSSINQPMTHIEHMFNAEQKDCELNTQGLRWQEWNNVRNQNSPIWACVCMAATFIFALSWRQVERRVADRLHWPNRLL